MTQGRNVGMGLGGLLLVAGLVWALWPQPIAVDLATVTRGPLQGTLAAQGVTRVREPYAITAPITGTVTRSPVMAGDSVTAGTTMVAEIRPASPGLMDARSRAQAEAAVAEAEASVALSETNLRQAETVLAHAETELLRGQALAQRGAIAMRMLDDLVAAHVTAGQNVAGAKSQLDLSMAALMRARAQLLGPETLFNGTDQAGECCLRIVAPLTGIVLDVADQSARLVQAGTPLLTIGDLDDMEIELDLLSTDAVRVPPGARAVIDRWGGEGVLEAKLRRIEPAAFTRVSALGIEEQRVRVRLDLLTPPEGRPGLGEAFRVHVQLILWEETSLLQVPQAALFRQDDGWAVFAEDQGRAALTPVRIGRQAEGSAEVLDGLTDGARVVLFPSSALMNGSAITERLTQPRDTAN